MFFASFRSVSSSATLRFERARAQRVRVPEQKRVSVSTACALPTLFSSTRERERENEKTGTALRGSQRKARRAQRVPEENSAFVCTFDFDCATLQFRVRTARCVRNATQRESISPESRLLLAALRAHVYTVCTVRCTCAYAQYVCPLNVAPFGIAYFYTVSVWAPFFRAPL